jgi:hypothetical protein
MGAAAETRRINARDLVSCFPVTCTRLGNSHHFQGGFISQLHRITTQRRRSFIPAYLLAVVEAIRLHIVHASP